MHLDRRFVMVISSESGVGADGVGRVLPAGRRAGGRTRAAAQKQVVVATRPLPAGSTLDRDSVKLRSVPERLFPAGAFSRVEDVLERPVISAIQAEEPVVEARLAVKGSGMGLGPMIPPGMRAISVRVNDVVGVAGFVLPGMRVDVLVTGKPPNRRRHRNANRAAEHHGALRRTDHSDRWQEPADRGAGGDAAGDVRAEAEALTLANIEGHIQLVLRNSTDQDRRPHARARLHELYGSAPPAEEAREAVPHKRTPARQVKPAPEWRHRSRLPVAAPAEPEQMIVIRRRGQEGAKCSRRNREAK